MDDNPRKQNTFSPGHHPPVLAPIALDEYRPDYAVILAWNNAQSIIDRNLPFLERVGHSIVPLPTVVAV